MSTLQTTAEDRFRVRTRLGVNMVVEAGAGTGKTTLLIDRLCFALLAQNIAPRRLVALTFTEKAAAEIKTRLIFKLQAVLSAARANTSESTLDVLREHFGIGLADIVERADLALQQLDRSQIGTIHSFCADILRSYPLEAGLTPNAEIDRGPRAERIFDTLWHRFLDKELGENAVRAEVWTAVLKKVSLDDLRACAREMCGGKIGVYEYFAQKELLQKVCRQKAVEAQTLAQTFLEGKKPRVIERALEQAAQRFTAAADWLQSGQLPASTQETIFIKSIPKDWDSASAAQAKALCRFAQQADPLQQQTVLQAYGLLAGLVEQVRKRYADEGILSFDDLIVKTRDLLQQNVEVRRRLKQLYDVLYVDEFQDTDPVQGELLLFLAEDPEQSAAQWEQVRLAQGKLFVVGDPKQSIYRFRGADITAYELFTDLILRQGGEKAYLRENHRSGREIVALANDVCSIVMQEKKAFQPAYEAIFTRREPCPGAAAAALILCREEQNAKADDLRHNQARFIARWIEEHVGKMVLPDGQKLRYGDIALLVRASTTTGPYIEALRRSGIAFAVEEDRDFYHRQEVMDFLNFLRAAEDPQDRVALFGLLRSPLGGLTDAELYQAARRGDMNWRKDSTDPKTQHLFKRLRAFAARVGRESLPELLRGLLTEDFWVAACTRAYDGEKSAQALQQLVALAENYCLQQPLTLGQLLAQIEQWVQQEAGRLGCAASAADAVNVMTVHKSKGLQFPVVIWADVSKQDSSSVANRPGYLYSWSLRLHGLRVGPLADINFAWLEEEQKEHARCEEVRVLYVALTRAKHYLLLVGNASVDEDCAAGMLQRAGRWPQEGKTPPCLGGAEGLAIQYVTYEEPKYFIYTRPQEEAQRPTAKELQQWRRSFDTRLLQYQSLLAEPTVVAPSALTEQRYTDPETLAFGSFCHAALARAWQMPQDGISGALDWAVRETGYANLREEGRIVLTPFFASGLFRRLRAMKVLGVEMPFTQQTADKQWQNGVIDLLLQDQKGTVWIIDFKTDNLPAEQVRIQAEEYRAQLAAYTAAVRRLMPGADVRAGVVFVRCVQMTEL